MATTPPPQKIIRTPATPLHGAKYDNLRRRSTRKATQPSSTNPKQAAASIATLPTRASKVTRNSLRSRKSKTASLRSATQTSSPSSTQTTPRVKRTGKTFKKAESTVDMDPPSSFNPSLDPAKDPSIKESTVNAAAGMLPTPAKTPRKKQLAPNAVNAAARVLFPGRPDNVQDVVPTSRKRTSKRQARFSLYSSVEDEGDNEYDKIEIYTDSKERVPQLDTSEDNPFFEHPAQRLSQTESTRSKKRKAPHSTVSEEVEQAFNRDEGMVYVFRGKKIFRKFPQEDEDEEPLAGGDNETSIRRPLTRSSIKPRLLFPTAKQRQDREAVNVEDEEATTEIEETQDQDMTGTEETQPTTPVKPSLFSPATPPTTGHATRARHRKTDFDPLRFEPPEPSEAPPEPRKKASPFDGWARMKPSSSGIEKGKKRMAEASVEDVVKRVRTDEKV